MISRDLALVLLFFAITPSLGFFSMFGILIIGFLLYSQLSSYISQKKITFLSSDTHHIIQSLFTLLFFATLVYPGYYQSPKVGMLGTIVLTFTVISVYLMFTRSKAKARSIVMFGVIMYCILGLWTITTSPNPSVDVYVMLKEGPEKIMVLQNPYSATFTKVYEAVDPNYYVYLPLSFLMTLPSVFLTQDPRFTLLITNSLTAFLIYYLFRKKDERLAALAGTTYLFLPRSFYMLEHMYLDPIIFFFFILTMFLISRKKLSLAALTLACFISIKQHIVALLPFILLDSKMRTYITRKRMMIFSVILFIPLMFFLIDPQAFLQDLVGIFSPTVLPAPVHNSLSVSNFIRFFQPRLSDVWHVRVSIVILASLYMYILKTGKIKYYDAMVLFMTMFSFLMMPSFFNHYYLIAMFLFYGVLAAAPSAPTKKEV